MQNCTFSFTFALFSQNCKIYFQSVDTWVASNYFTDLRVTVFNDSNRVSNFNFTGTLLKDLRRVMLTFEVKIKSETSKTYDKPFLTSNVDICKQINFGNYIIKFLVSNIEKYSNIRFECPLKTRFYYAYNFPAPDSPTAFLPSFMSKSLYTQWELSVMVKAKVSKTEPSARVLLINIRGETCPD